MSRNDAEDFAQRLYARIPGQYRVYDKQQGFPLLALMRVIGEQVSAVRLDLDLLWDNFFIETCEDWVVPYIGALVGTNLLGQPVGQSNRMDVWNTIIWRRSKGTPRMLAALAEAISGWPVDFVEFFQTLGWSQNMNHLRLDHPISADVHSPFRLGQLGRATDPFAHAADFKPARPLDQSRATPASLGIGRFAWGTPGRYQIKNLGFFARRLNTFAVKGATPAADVPGANPPLNASLFTFDPLFRNVPLFRKERAEPLTRAAFSEAPSQSFGSDVAVRQSGILLASSAQPAAATSASTDPFTFGGLGAGMQLDATVGMRLLNASQFRLGGAHFTITALWQEGGGPVVLGSISTLQAAADPTTGFHPGVTATATGQLVIAVGSGFPGLAPSSAARFPGGVIAVRAAATGPLRTSDALYVYLPPAFVAPGAPLLVFVASDGSTYNSSNLTPVNLARASEGRVYPPRPVAPSATPATGFLLLNRAVAGVQLLDASRFGTTGAGIVVRADICDATFQAIGAVASQNLAGFSVTGIVVPDPWPANTYLSSTASLSGTLPSTGLTSLHISAVGGTVLPELELILTNRAGESLLVYLPPFDSIPAAGADLFVAADGSTYFVPGDQTARRNAVAANSLAGLPLGRAASGQVLPIPGAYPIEQRRPVALDLCRPERTALLAPGELGIDPELGRFAFAKGDPVIGAPGLSVDYVEAFSSNVGALTFDRQLLAAPAANRFISRTGDAPAAAVLAGAPVHTSVADAFAKANSKDVIEIIDSATYAQSGPAPLSKPAVRDITLRAAEGQRPCLTSYSGAATPAVTIGVAVPMDRLELNGLLISGGPIVITRPVTVALLTACTLDPEPAAVAGGSLRVTDTDRDSAANYVLCRCIAGSLHLGAGVGRVTIADSIVDGRGGVAIEGIPPPANSAAVLVQLERVTVLGRVRCEVLNASECLLDDIVIVEDQQLGCIRFSRFELGSVLPRRFQCVPTEDQVKASHTLRCLAPLFNSLRFGRPNYLQLAAGCPPEILAASEEIAEVGAFAGALNPIRVQNVFTKLREFMPAGLSAVVIGET